MDSCHRVNQGNFSYTGAPWKIHMEHKNYGGLENVFPFQRGDSLGSIYVNP